MADAAGGAPSTAAVAARLTSAFGLARDAAHAAALQFAAADPSLRAALFSRDLDQAGLEQLLQQASRGGRGSRQRRRRRRRRRPARQRPARPRL